jgi:hypothetical protein
MEENKFEKQVEQKMVEFTVQPSEAVWQKIESRIEKKKPSRKFLIFFLLFTGLLSAGIWYATREPKDTAKYNLTSSHIPIKNDSAKTIHDDESKSTIKSPILTPGTGFNKTASVLKIRAYKQPGKNEKITAVTRAATRVSINSQQANTSGETREFQSTVVNVQAPPGPAGNEASQQMLSKRLADDTASSVSSNVSKVTPNDSSKQSVSKLVTDTSIELKIKSTAFSKSSNKWQTGFVFSMGISGVGNNFPGLSNSAASLYTNGGGVVPGSFTQSATRAGFGFTIGIKEEKKISRKLSIVTGLNFTSLNTSNKVGTDSSRLSTIDAKSNYINHYNFIELPLSLKFDLSNNKNFPVYWQAGFTIGQFIGSNALQFNQVTGIYYQDNSIFNKTQLGLSTGLLTALGSKQKNPILFGPWVYYGASKIATEGMYNQKHFVFVSLRAEIKLGK